MTPLEAKANPPARNDDAIVLEAVYKTYDRGRAEVHALNGVDLQFERGSFWAVLGPSGSGKSTLLNLIGCLDRPTHGRYWLQGRDVSLLDDEELSRIRLREMGFIFQSFNLIAQLNVRENIELPLFYLGWNARQSAARARELAEMVGLANRLDHRPMELSGGQQQRVAVARALANDPDLLLADEPTGNLDSRTGIQIMDMLAGLHESGKTIVMVTHEPAVAAYASHQLHMRDGQVDEIREGA
jgi:putative ABC transport system ATP-binding protein